MTDQDENEHLQNLEKVLKRLDRAGFKPNKKIKTVFFILSQNFSYRERKDKSIRALLCQKILLKLELGRE